MAVRLNVHTPFQLLLLGISISSPLHVLLLFCIICNYSKCGYSSTRNTHSCENSVFTEIVIIFIKLFLL